MTTQHNHDLANTDTAEQTRKEAILQAAIEYFGTLGFYGTSLQKIATKVGLIKRRAAFSCARRHV